MPRTIRLDAALAFLRQRAADRDPPRQRIRARSRPRDRELQPPCPPAFRRDEQTVGSELGHERKGIQQILEPWAQMSLALVVELRSQLHVVHEPVLDSDGRVIRALRREEPGY